MNQESSEIHSAIIHVM